MKNALLLILSVLYLIHVFVNAGPAYAYTTPSFPSCTQPQGDLKVKYDTGVHGIVGSTEDHNGSDAVYQITSETLVQCFCPPQGTGIQTNWWKVTNVTPQDVESLKNDGWFYIPNGALWGLDPVAYVAANSEFSCTNAGTSGSMQQSTGTSTGVAEAAQAFLTNATGTITGLGATGNMENIVTIFGLGVLLLLVGIVLRKERK